MKKRIELDVSESQARTLEDAVKARISTLERRKENMRAFAIFGEATERQQTLMMLYDEQIETLKAFLNSINQ